MPELTVHVMSAAEVGTNHIEGAARVWASATALRDGVPSPAQWIHQVAGIRARLDLPEASLVCAERGGALEGFAIVAMGDDDPEVFYLATRPEAWGAGVAQQMLATLDQWARDAGVAQVRLWVIDDNRRARSVYERAGWTPTTQLQHSGQRVERLHLRDLAPATPR